MRHRRPRRHPHLWRASSCWRRAAAAAPGGRARRRGPRARRRGGRHAAPGPASARPRRNLCRRSSRQPASDSRTSRSTPARSTWVELADGIASGRFELGSATTSRPIRGWRRPRSTRCAPTSLLPASHRLAAASGCRLAELTDEPLALLDLPQSRDYFADLFRSVGPNPTRAVPDDERETCRAMVARGLAYTVLNARPRGEASAGRRRGGRGGHRGWRTTRRPSTW